MYVNVYSKAGRRHGQNFLYNFVTVNILPEIKRIRGVGTATILGNRKCNADLPGSQPSASHRIR